MSGRKALSRRCYPISLPRQWSAILYSGLQSPVHLPLQGRFLVRGGAWLVLAFATGLIPYDGAPVLSLSEAEGYTPTHDANYFAK